MTAPKYVLINALALDRLPRAQLGDLLREVLAEPPTPGFTLPDGVWAARNADQARALRVAREAYWGLQADPAPPVPRTRGGSARITAAEANAVLAAMPEVPTK